MVFEVVREGVTEGVAAGRTGENQEIAIMK